MILGLTRREFELAKELTHVALANAAASFSKMMRDQFTFQKIEVNPSRFQFSKANKFSNGHLYIMMTEYFGDVLADTFLVVDTKQAEVLVKTLMPKPNLSEHLKEAVLLETDNILAASVATKYSDILGHSVTGDVPKLLKKSPKETQKFIDEKLEHDHTHFSFVTKFKSKEKKLEAYFVCAFRDSFGNAIKSIASQQETVALIDQEEALMKQYLRAR